jgi:hypothetical protein
MDKGFLKKSINILIISMSFCVSCDKKERMMEFVSRQQYEGVVVDKFIDKRNHATQTLLVGSRKYDLPTPLFDQIEIGDSIVKKKGFYTIERYRMSKLKLIAYNSFSSYYPIDTNYSPANENTQ